MNRKRKVRQPTANRLEIDAISGIWCREILEISDPHGVLDYNQHVYEHAERLGCSTRTIRRMRRKAVEKVAACFVLLDKY